MKKIPGYGKDENGIYNPKPVSDPDLSLDDIGKRVILAVDTATKILLTSIIAGNVDRETIGALKDCQAMLKDLKKDEKDFLASLGDEQLNAANIK